MAKVFGENALIYLGTPGSTTRLPLINDWEVNIEQEKVESPKVMFCPGLGESALSWVSRSGGQYSANGSISTLYDGTDHDAITLVLADAVVATLIYPDCLDLTSYWKGNAWLQLSHRGASDEYISVDFDFESDGQWVWAT